MPISHSAARPYIIFEDAMRNASSTQTFSAKAGGSTLESQANVEPGPPIAIFHYDINKDLDGYVPAAPSLLYFWLEDRPVGHIWLLTPHQIPQLRDAAASTIDVEALLLARREASAEWRSSLSTTVVICTRDRPDALRRCLASLQNQTRQADQMLVVDNASKDENVRDIAREAGADYLREERLGLDHARNAGALAALGDIVLFTDDDVEPHPRWLECMTNGFDADHVAAVTGLVLPAEPKDRRAAAFRRFWSFGQGYRRVGFWAGFFRFGSNARMSSLGNPALARAWHSAAMSLMKSGCLTSGSTWQRPDARATPNIGTAC